MNSVNSKPQQESGFPIIEVGLDDKVLSDEQAIEALRAQTGIASLRNDEITGLAGLGIYSRGVGVLRTQRGQVVVTQAVLRNTLTILHKRLEQEHARGAKAKQSVIRGYADQIAKISSVLNDSTDTALGLEKAAAPTGKPDDVERPRNTSFGSGTVIVAPNAHEIRVNEPKKELPSNGGGA